MFWFFYQWLWPLFEPCTTVNAIVMHGLSPLRVRYGNGGPVYTFNGPMAWTLSVCPTPMMNLLLLLGVLGVVVIVVGIVWFIRTVLLPTPHDPLDLIVDETYHQLDRAADDYLKRVHF